MTEELEAKIEENPETETETSEKLLFDNDKNIQIKPVAQDESWGSEKKSPRSALAKDTPIGPPICKFDDFGCQYKGSKDRIKEHVDAEPVRHLSLLNDAVLIMKPEVFALHEELERRMDQFEDIYIRHDRLIKRYGSHLLWRIAGYAEKLEKAKAGVEKIIFSPPFLTAAHGYKMIASAALNGDGKGQDHFMSLFVAIMKGNFDPFLAWPFNHSVSFALLDQSEDVGQRKDIVNVLKPNVNWDENKVFLGRPTKERNPSFGFQRFVEIKVLEDMQYVKNDCLFIKINVDATDMDVI